MEQKMTSKEERNKLANDVAEVDKADVLLINSQIYESNIVNGLIDNNRVLSDELCLSSPRKNCLVILVTNGGDPDVGYQIARCLQRTYSENKEGNVLVLIPGSCKSTGTLIAIGANELVMGDDGELGPLDVQLRKKDAIIEQMSGLDVEEALVSLQKKSFKAFEETLLNLNLKSNGGISLKTAMDVATQLTVGLFKPIYEQINPMHVGEIARAIKIAREYGKRLDGVANNLKKGALKRLIDKYPSHGFVIDRKEAGSLFKCVREPNPAEKKLLALLKQQSLLQPKRSSVKFISTENNSSNSINTVEEMQGGTRGH